MTAEKKVPRWTDRTDRSWPVEVVPAWAYDALKRENERLQWSLAEVKKEVCAVTPDWKRALRIMDQAGVAP